MATMDDTLTEEDASMFMQGLPQSYDFLTVPDGKTYRQTSFLRFVRTFGTPQLLKRIKRIIEEEQK